MVNPVKPNSNVNLPPLNAPMVDMATGSITLAWYEPLYSLYLRTGGQQGLSLGVVSTTANNALTLAGTANGTAALAQANAVTAQGTAATALANSVAALNAVTAIGGQTGNVMQRFNNLNDVLSIPQSRANLGVAVTEASFMFDGVPAANKPCYVPVVRNYSTAVNFAGSLTHCGTVPAANAIFTVQRIRGGVTNILGTIVLINGGQGSTMTAALAGSLQAGDILAIIAPAVPDATLANVGISVALTLT